MIDAKVEVIQDGEVYQQVDDEPSEIPHWKLPHNVEYDPEIDDFPPHEPILQPFEEELERAMKEQKELGKV